MQILHLGVGSLEDMPWMSFEDGIEHSFLGAPGSPPVKGIRLADLAPYLPDADFIHGYDEQLPSRHGLPFLFVQGYRTFTPAIEDAMFRAPCPKVCISRWLVDVGRQKGVPADELVHIPNGLQHEKYRLVSPVEKRPPLVSTQYRSHRVSRPELILKVLAEVKRRVPALEATLFSTEPPVHETPPWMTVVTDPPQEFIVNEIYNRSSIYLCASRWEGFGATNVEAMACGAALVTTSNGGSDEYAIHEETALVCEPDDTAALADNVERLLQDDELRIRLARQGMQYVRETYDWDRSAEKFTTFLSEYAANRRDVPSG
jgi:glycosyltransferase involved in cell wall biosynthesis